jgi:hypothetical protein
MILNYYNILRNLIFLFLAFVIYCFFITDVNSQSAMSICDSTNKGWHSTDNRNPPAGYGSNICTTKCSDLKVNDNLPANSAYPNRNLTDNDYGMCAGSATSSSLTIYRIDLGTSSGFSGSDKCTVFQGNITTDFSKLSKGQTGGSGVFNIDSCVKGKSYDRVYLYINRLQSFAGHTVFPDGSGTIARTTSACANNDTTATVSDTSWLDTTTVAYTWSPSSTKCWGKPRGWSSGAHIKADKTSFLTSISNSTDALVTYDDFKVFFETANGTPDSEGFYKESKSDGDYLRVKVDSDPSKNIYSIKNGADFMSGLPIVFDKSEKKLDLKISYYTPNIDNDTTVGVTFLFRRIGSTGNAELVGYLPSDNGMYLTFSYQ